MSMTTSAVAIPRTAETGKATIRVGLFRNPEGIEGFSMERYANALHLALAEVRDDLALHPVQPRGASGSPPRRRISLYWRRYPVYMSHARRTKFDVNHVLDHAYAHLAFTLDPQRTIVTCHDIFPLRHWLGTIDGLLKRRLPPLTVRYSLAGLRRARLVVAVSQSTKDDIVELFGLDESRVRVVPNGVDDEFTVADPLDAVARFPLAGEGVAYILSVDTGSPYKNQRAMLEVLARVAARTRRDVRLVHVGQRFSPPLRELARSLGITHRVFDVGVVTREEMGALYARATALLFPSLYEGFGFPPLDAMARGVPVVASQARAVAEVVADAALTADANDYEALAAQLLRVLDDDVISHALVLRGRERAAQFTWRRTAQQISQLYDEVLDEVHS